MSKKYFAAISVGILLAMNLTRIGIPINSIGYWVTSLILNTLFISTYNGLKK